MARLLSVSGRRLLGGGLALIALVAAALLLVRDPDPVDPEVVGAWRELPPPPVVADRGSALGWTGSEVLVIGGTASPECSGLGFCKEDWLRDGAAYDMDAGTWRALPEVPVSAGVGAGSHVMVGDRMVLLDADGGWWQYDASEDAWSDLPDPPHRAGQLTALGGLVYALPGDYEDQASVDVLDVDAATWTTLPRRPRPHDIETPWAVATEDGVALLGIAAPGSSSDDPYRADVFDGSRWHRVDGPTVTVHGEWHWTGERLVMPMPDLDHRTGDAPTLVLDLEPLAFDRLPEGPYYESGGWGVRAAAGERVFTNGFVYDDSDGTWTDVRRPSSDMGELEGQETVAGVVAGDRTVVVGEGTAWMSVP